MAREVFFSRDVDGIGHIDATINFDETAFGLTLIGATPWTVSIHCDDKDLGRIVGFEGDGQHIIGMHGLKPDVAAQRGAEMTVFRVNDGLRTHKLDAAVLSALERWLLKRGWRGNLVKKIRRQPGKDYDALA